jgi:hypothetical protein
MLELIKDTIASGTKISYFVRLNEKNLIVNKG